MIVDRRELYKSVFGSEVYLNTSKNSYDPFITIFASSGHCLFRQVIVSLIPFHQGFLVLLPLNTTE